MKAQFWRSSTFQVLFIAFAIFLASSSALGASVDPALIKDLQSKLCADPEWNKTPTGDATSSTAPAPKDTPNPSAKLEANAECTECGIKVATDGTKLTDVTKNTEPIAKVLDTAVEQARVKRELAYFKQFASSGGDSLSQTKQQLESYKKGLAEMKVKLDKEKALLDEYEQLSSALTSFVNGQSELSSESKAALAKLATQDLDSHKYYADQYSSLIAKLKSKIENSEKQNPGSAGNVDYWKSDLANYEKHHKTRSEIVAADQELIDWVKSSENLPVPPQSTFTRINQTLKSKISDLKSAAKSYASDVKSYQDVISPLETKVKELEEAEQASLSADPAEDKDLKLLRHYETKYKSSFPKNNPGFNTCGMSVAEVLALARYTADGYDPLNRALRTGGEEAQKYKAFEEVLNSALGKIRSYEGTVNRGATLPNAVLDQHKVGDIATYAAYTSTSVGSGFTSRAHRFVIKSKTGKYIAPLSTHYSEQEVLFKSNTKFKVLSREEKGSVIEFVMEEVTDETDAK